MGLAKAWAARLAVGATLIASEPPPPVYVPTGDQTGAAPGRPGGSGMRPADLPPTQKSVVAVRRAGDTNTTRRTVHIVRFEWSIPRRRIVLPLPLRLRRPPPVTQRNRLVLLAAFADATVPSALAAKRSPIRMML